MLGLDYRVQENLKAALLRGQGAEHAFRVAPAPGPDEVCTFRHASLALYLLILMAAMPVAYFICGLYALCRRPSLRATRWNEPVTVTLCRFGGWSTGATAQQG